MPSPSSHDPPFQRGPGRARLVARTLRAIRGRAATVVLRDGRALSGAVATAHGHRALERLVALEMETAAEGGGSLTVGIPLEGVAAIIVE